MTTDLNTPSAEFVADLNAALRRVMPGHVSPRYRYFGSSRGWMFGWTTERVEGKFQSFAYKPVGSGARTKKATRWELTSVLDHATRKAAKARALRLYRQHKETTP